MNTLPNVLSKRRVK